MQGNSHPKSALDCDFMPTRAALGQSITCGESRPDHSLCITSLIFTVSLPQPHTMLSEMFGRLTFACRNLITSHSSEFDHPFSGRELFSLATIYLHVQQLYLNLATEKYISEASITCSQNENQWRIIESWPFLPFLWGAGTLKSLTFTSF